MPEFSREHHEDRQSGGERVFTDEYGRLWSASHTASHSPSHGVAPGDAAVVFACISDSRETVRAIAVGSPFRMPDVADDTLREWLRDAPRIGRLIE